MNKITQSEFIKEYCQRSKIEEKELNSLGQFAAPCDCDYEKCKGWQMINLENLKIELDLRSHLFDKDNKELIERIKERVTGYWTVKESTDWQLQTEYAKKLLADVLTILEELGKEAGK